MPQTKRVPIATWVLSLGLLALATACGGGGGGGGTPPTASAGTNQTVVGDTLVKLNGPLAGANPSTKVFIWAPDSSRVACGAPQDSATANEIYTPRPDGAFNQKISGPMVAGTGVSGLYSWSP